MTPLIESLLKSEKMPEINSRDVHNTAIVLESQEKECERLISEGTASADVSQFIPIFMPLARRVMPQLIANELVGVQPLTMPQGYIFSIAFRYTGDSQVSAKPVNNSTIIQVAAEEATKLAQEIGKTLKFTNGGNNKEGAVLYVEGDKVLVGVAGITSKDTVAVGTNNPVTAGNVPAAVKATYSSELAYQKVFKNYTGSHTTAIGEQLDTDM